MSNCTEEEIIGPRLNSQSKNTSPLSVSVMELIIELLSQDVGLEALRTGWADPKYFHSQRPPPEIGCWQQRSPQKSYLIFLGGLGGGTQCLYMISEVAMPCDLQAIGHQKTPFWYIRVRVSTLSGHKFPLWVPRLAIMN